MNTTALMSTASAAKNIAVLFSLLPTPGSSALPVGMEQLERVADKTTTWWPLSRPGTECVVPDLPPVSSVANVKTGAEVIEFDRTTTPQERIVGELRRWVLLDADWDGEGAAAPIPRSLKDAVAFVRLLTVQDTLPEPMLNATGHAGLYWKEARLYADVEFLGDGRLAYYIERNGDKHKGVLTFDAKHMPPVLSALLRA